MIRNFFTICIFDTPNFEAVRIYGASRSCSTSPRITRAREVQWLRATPATTPVNPRPQAMEISITRRICGIPIIRSIHQEITASATLPRTAQAVPRIRAIRALTAAVSSPIRILSDSPAKVRANISLPIQSVPNKNAPLGGRFFLVKSVAIAESSTAIPANMIATNTAAPATANQIVECLRFLMFICSAPPFGCEGLSHHKVSPQADFPRTQAQT